MLVLIVCLDMLISCSQKQASKEDATKQLISNLFDACKAGKNSDAGAQLFELLPASQRQKLKADKFDYSNPEHKNEADRMCRDINGKYGGGYEFGKFDVQPKSDGSEVLGWEVFPKGGKEGQVWAFKQENGKYVLVDIDPAKR